MNTFSPVRQQGAVMVIALVMLLVLTLLATNSMRGTALDARITANRAQSLELQNMADAALREGEFRLIGPGFVRDKLEANMSENCKKNNKLKSNKLNKPCLLPMLNAEDETELLRHPLTFVESKAEGWGQGTGAAVDAAGDDAALAWMPYRGLDANNLLGVGEGTAVRGYWNVYRLDEGGQDNMTINPEYGAGWQSSGKSPAQYFYLVTGQANDEVAAQSTMTMIFLGFE